MTIVVSSRAAIAPTIKIAVSLISAGSSLSGAFAGAWLAVARDPEEAAITVNYTVQCILVYCTV